jgi:hypothetical protein
VAVRAGIAQLNNNGLSLITRMINSSFGALLVNEELRENANFCGNERCQKLAHTMAARPAEMAEREGFEPPNSCPLPDFESGAFDHSAISPC